MKNYIDKAAKGLMALPIVFSLGGCEKSKPNYTTKNGVTMVDRGVNEKCYFDAFPSSPEIIREISRTEYCGDKEFVRAWVVGLPDTDGTKAVPIDIDTSGSELGRGRDAGRAASGDRTLVRKDSPHGQELERKFQELKSRYESSQAKQE